VIPVNDNAHCRYRSFYLACRPEVILPTLVAHNGGSVSVLSGPSLSLSAMPSTRRGQGPHTRGTVVSISAAYCRHAPRPGDGRTRYPVSGSGVLVPLTRADRFQQDRDELEFTGYVVRLEVPEPRI